MNGMQFAEALALCAGKCGLPNLRPGGGDYNCQDLLMALAKAEVPDLARRLVRWRCMDDPGEQGATTAALRAYFPLPDALIGAAIWEWLAPAICLTCCGGQANGLVRDEDIAEGDSPALRTLLELIPIVRATPTEIRKAAWADMKLEARRWQVSSDTHKVLSRQAVTIVKNLHALTGSSPWLFPGRDPKKPISQSTLDAALGLEPPAAPDFGPCPACGGTGMATKRHAPPGGLTVEVWRTYERDYQRMLDELADLTRTACVRAAALLTEKSLDEVAEYD